MAASYGGGEGEHDGPAAGDKKDMSRWAILKVDSKAPAAVFEPARTANELSNPEEQRGIAGLREPFWSWVV